jgi:hypothetical protein
MRSASLQLPVFSQVRNRSPSGVLPSDEKYFHNGSIVNKDGEWRCKRTSSVGAWM